LKSNISNILSPNSSTLIADDYSMFRTTTGLQEGFAFEIDFLINVKANGRIFVVVHYIGDSPISLEDCMIISDINYEKSTDKIIHFDK